MAPSATTLRVMTYNVHRCLGRDGVLSPARIARVIARYEPDVVALQELDVSRARSGYIDQPGQIARHLEMRHLFHPAFRVADEHYGDAILSRHPLELVRAGELPTLPHRCHLERRGALWATVRWNGHDLQMINTHLGLNRRERLAQVEALLGPEWLAHPDCRPPRLLCGDLNAGPGSPAFRRLRQVFRDAQHPPRLARARATFPALLPVLRIDHVLHSLDLSVRRAWVPRTRLTRVASDHLPLVVELTLP